MLTEQFIASIGVPLKAPTPNVVKDAALFLYELQPLHQQRQMFKKSATSANCLAVSDTHVFAAQTDRGVVHVYSRERGNQEATVPFPDRISSIVLACDDTVLIIGTVEGRVFLWETCTGRQVTTTQAHLQSITALAVDATSNFLLSASNDSSVHVWSIPALLSFSTTDSHSPLRTFSSHHDEVTSLALGQSASNCNFAVSVSKDRTCLVWDYRTNSLLRTYLLPAIPLCLALDPADRAAYVGYEDGSVQSLDLLATPIGQLDAIQSADHSTEPIQPPSSSQWKSPDVFYGAALSLSTSWDGCALLSGHQSGSILRWDVAGRTTPNIVTPLPLPGPVSNVQFLPVSGFHQTSFPLPSIKINEVVKPKFGAFDTSDSGAVPGNYAMNVQLVSDLKPSHVSNQTSSFLAALTAPTFPTTLLDDGLCELASWGKTGTQVQSQLDADGDDSMPLLECPAPLEEPKLQTENARLKAELEAMRRVQKKTFEKMERLSEEKRALLKKQNGLNRGDEGSSD